MSTAHEAYVARAKRRFFLTCHIISVLSSSVLLLLLFFFSYSTIRLNLMQKRWVALHLKRVHDLLFVQILKMLLPMHFTFFSSISIVFFSAFKPNRLFKSAHYPYFTQRVIAFEMAQFSSVFSLSTVICVFILKSERKYFTTKEWKWKSIIWIIWLATQQLWSVFAELDDFSSWKRFRQSWKCTRHRHSTFIGWENNKKKKILSLPIIWNAVQIHCSFFANRVYS